LAREYVIDVTTCNHGVNEKDKGKPRQEHFHH